MTPKEKANELFTKNHNYNRCFNTAKLCSLVCVNELINDCDASSPFEIERLEFWKEVKKEIKKL